MVRVRIISIMLFSMFALSSFAKDRVIAVYNGKDILKSQIEQRLRGFHGKLPENKSDFDDYNVKTREQFINTFVQEKLLVDAAQAAKTTEDPAYKAQLDMMKNQLKIKIYLDKYVDNKITPLMVRTAYNQYVKDLKENDELKISHILFKTEAEANKALAEIKADQMSFENAAKKYSVDTMSKGKGGDLGFIAPGQTVPEFESAAYNLKKGSISAPVKTNFGWHIIKRFNSRKRKIPSFNEIEKNIEQQMKVSLMQQHVSQLIRNAKIEIFPENK